MELVGKGLSLTKIVIEELANAILLLSLKISTKHPKTSVTVAEEQFHEAIEKQVNFVIT